MSKDNAPLTMIRANIIEKIVEKTDNSHEDAIKIFESFLSVATEGMAKDGQLKLVGFGTFDVLRKKERPGRNPKTKEVVTISPRRSISFNPSLSLKDKVNLS